MAKTKTKTKTDPHAALGRRLKCWVELFSQRPDIEVMALSIGEPHLSVPKNVPRALRSILRTMNGVHFAWRFPDEPANTNQLRIGALPEDGFALSGHVKGSGVFGESLNALNYDERVTGSYVIDTPSYELVVRLVSIDAKKQTKVVFTDANSVVSGIVGDMPRYFGDGAKHAFMLGWLGSNDRAAKARLKRLEEASKRPTAKKARREALVEKGLGVTQAADMVDWLGVGVSLLLPTK